MCHSVSTLTPSKSPEQRYLTSIVAGQVQDADGAALGNRTPDLFITSEMLYRLS